MTLIKISSALLALKNGHIRERREATILTDSPEDVVANFLIKVSQLGKAQVLAT